MTHTEFLKHIGMELRVARVRRNMTSPKLAKITGISVSAIIKIENGQSDVRILTLKRLAEALGVSLKDVL